MVPRAHGLEEAWQPTPVFLPGESPWTEETVGLYGPWGHKESDKTKQISTAQGLVELIAPWANLFADLISTP